MKHFVITLTRQFASQGRSIAQVMSRELGINFYDRDIVEATASRLGLPVRFIGVGEGIDDLLPFTPEGFVEELLPRQWKH